MPSLLIYFIKLSLNITLVFLFYYCVLRKLTFYTSGRVYLMASAVLSFVIPLINIAPVLKHSDVAQQWAETILPPDNYVISHQAAIAPVEAVWSGWELIMLVILAGMGVMLLRLGMQLISLRRMQKKSTYFSDRGMHFYQVNEHIIPFSFGNSIFLNKDLHSESELCNIISHEFVHVKQKHSIDIFLAELLCLVNWYNPFAWLLKKAIRQNLEFIADDKVLQTGILKKQYQYLLLKVVGDNKFSIAPKFNFASLQARIYMMNKNKSAKKHLVKFLLILPLILVLLVAFRKRDPLPQKTSKGKKMTSAEVPGQQPKTVPELSTAKLQTTKTAPLPIAPLPVKAIQPQADPALVQPSAEQGFTGLEGIISDNENTREYLHTRFANIQGTDHYYTLVGDKITYYNRSGQQVDSKGNLVSAVQANASEVLPGQYILKVYKNGKIVCAFNEDKTPPLK